jgi:hypothetical protein|tara:strand:+ start:213 stop:587 length:375 start_codon:yes stop_codon:yes gene_type:complete
MGYRSQVVLAIANELQPHFMAALSTCNEATALVFNDSDEFDREYADGEAWLIRWDSIKWYDTFQEVATIEKFVAAANEDCFELGEDEGESSDYIKFVRVGENSDDIEHLGFGFDSVYSSTHINY